MVDLHGPLPVRKYANPWPDVPELASGVHYTAERETYEANEALLSPYYVTPANPLQFVMLGDSEENGYPNTFPIRFPDQATADSVIATVT